MLVLLQYLWISLVIKFSYKIWFLYVIFIQKIFAIRYIMCWKFYLLFSRHSVTHLVMFSMEWFMSLCNGRCVGRLAAFEFLCQLWMILRYFCFLLLRIKNQLVEGQEIMVAIDKAETKKISFELNLW